MQENQETLLEFPCRFPIKVMAKSHETLEEDVAAIVAKHHQDIENHEIYTRPSKQGRYSSVTVIIEATSKQQLDNIYLELTSQSWVLMAL
ncbi:MAG: DUF493 domain-containing protein [Gammaproteobacteria bacterium]|nr:DUF493 domain-containing protein [Gammaproteobacteria bacterium]MDH5692297.1 DUF493 domain-containing protein [Gammaproteobacteria bacterium]